ncbi:hypothetical protein HK101_002912, partial [Irineochytrium annulatum]
MHNEENAGLIDLLPGQSVSVAIDAPGAPDAAKVVAAPTVVLAKPFTPSSGAVGTQKKRGRPRGSLNKKTISTAKLAKPAPTTTGAPLPKIKLRLKPPTSADEASVVSETEVAADGTALKVFGGPLPAPSATFTEPAASPARLTKEAARARSSTPLSVSATNGASTALSKKNNVPAASASARVVKRKKESAPAESISPLKMEHVTNGTNPPSPTPSEPAGTIGGGGRKDVYGVFYPVDGEVFTGTEHDRAVTLLAEQPDGEVFGFLGASGSLPHQMAEKRQKKKGGWVWIEEAVVPGAAVFEDGEEEVIRKTSRRRGGKGDVAGEALRTVKGWEFSRLQEGEEAERWWGYEYVYDDGRRRKQAKAEGFVDVDEEPGVRRRKIRGNGKVGKVPKPPLELKAVDLVPEPDPVGNTLFYGCLECLTQFPVPDKMPPPRTWFGEPMLVCLSCHFPYHPKCQGVGMEATHDGGWTCRGCRASEARRTGFFVQQIMTFRESKPHVADTREAVELVKETIEEKMRQTISVIDTKEPGTTIQSISATLVPLQITPLSPPQTTTMSLESAVAASTTSDGSLKRKRSASSAIGTNGASDSGTAMEVDAIEKPFKIVLQVPTASSIGGKKKKQKSRSVTPQLSLPADAPRASSVPLPPTLLGGSVTENVRAQSAPIVNPIPVRAASVVKEEKSGLALVTWPSEEELEAQLARAVKPLEPPPWALPDPSELPDPEAPAFVTYHCPSPPTREFLVKFNGLSYAHCEWVSARWVESRWPLLAAAFWEKVANETRAAVDKAMGDVEDGAFGPVSAAEMVRQVVARVGDGPWPRRVEEVLPGPWIEVDKILAVGVNRREAVDSGAEIDEKVEEDEAWMLDNVRGRNVVVKEMRKKDTKRIMRGRPKPVTALIAWKGLPFLEASWEVWPSGDKEPWKGWDKALKDLETDVARPDRVQADDQPSRGTTRSTAVAYIPFCGIHSSAACRAPLKFLRDILVLRKATATRQPPFLQAAVPVSPSGVVSGGSKVSGDGTDPGQQPAAALVALGAANTKQTVSDFLTVLSQLVLLGSAGLLLLSAAYPEAVSDRLEGYKETLTKRRHEKMLQFMRSQRPYVLGNVIKEEEGSNEGILFFKNKIYHNEQAERIRELLFQSPTLRFGILIGPPGCGKSRLMRSLSTERPYYSFLSLGLISGVKSLVDALSEEVGYAKRLPYRLSSYLFNGATSTFPTQLDKLAFLLDEYEEAAWMLKFDPNNKEKHRPLLVIDDIDSLDLHDNDTQKALTMLFNAANKWAREDTALVIFTLTDTAYHSGPVGARVRRDLAATSNIFAVGELTRPEARRFLADNLRTEPLTTSPGATTTTRKGWWPFSGSSGLWAGGRDAYDRILDAIGMNMGDLLRVCETVTKSGRPLDDVLKVELEAARRTVARCLADVEQRRVFGKHADVGLAARPTAVVPRWRMRRLLRFLDAKVAAGDVGGDGRRIWDFARDAGLHELVEALVECGMLG